MTSFIKKICFVFFDLTPSIHLSALTGDAKEVAKFLSDGVDVNAVDNKRDTPLMIAVRWGYKDIAELLLEKGADPNIQNVDFDTPIGEVTLVNRKNDVENTALLLEYGADPNITNSSGDSALHRLFFYNYKYALEIVPLLLENGADHELTNNLGQTALHVALDYRHNFKNSYEVISLLLDATTDINITDNDSWSALDYICDDKNKSSFDYALVQRLIEMGIDISKANYIAIDDCTNHEKNEIVELLMKAANLQ